ncbi:MAG TPA: dihydrofolate reductase family protein [Solirubrobacterales bacterium]|nr:dihydrofolate reductase family protein [Solirubrobacterales bacterium]
MSKVKAQISISLDGFIAGPNQSEEHPLGEGGMDLHEWVFKLSSWQQAHGRESGEGDENPSNAVIQEAQEGTGAVVMGRNMFAPVRGEWTEPAWNGWWGDEPPFHTPVFVLTHHEREPLEMEGGTTFYFVTEGVESAIVQAKEAAGDLDVSIGGGAATIQQAIAAGLLDELLLNQVPIVLGGGARLLENLGEPAPKLEIERVVAGPEATHLYYALN